MKSLYWADIFPRKVLGYGSIFQSSVLLKRKNNRTLAEEQTLAT
jgi:hypothetical protein